MFCPDSILIVGLWLLAAFIIGVIVTALIVWLKLRDLPLKELKKILTRTISKKREIAMDEHTLEYEFNWVQLQSDAVIVPIGNVRQLAEQFGESSAAAVLLRQSRCHTGPVRFWYSEKLNMLSLEVVEDKRH